MRYNISNTNAIEYTINNVVNVIIMKRKISVSDLIRTMNYLFGENYNLSSDCICMLRLYGNNINGTCPVHPKPKEPTTTTTYAFIEYIINNFAFKNIQYINSENVVNLLNDKSLRMLLPLVLHVHQDVAGLYHLNIKQTTILNFNCISFINLLIINIIKCNGYCRHSITQINIDKIITFKYMIIINCKRNRPQPYIKRNLDGYFNINIGKFLSNICVQDPPIS